MTTQERCRFFWGSHGCDLEAGHGAIHQCDARDPDGPCCEYDEQASSHLRVRFFVDEPGRWGEWGPFPDGWYQ